MKKFSQISESLDKWESIQDYLLELTESKFLELCKSNAGVPMKPELTNDWGESGNDFNPTIKVIYSILESTNITDTSILDSYISKLNSLSTALKRGGVKFNLSDNNLTIYFDLPSKLIKLMDDIREYKSRKDSQLGYSFLIDLEESLIKIDFEIDSNFVIKLDVQGLSWGHIGKLNDSEDLQKKLIDLFTKTYGFKFVGDFIENRQLLSYGRVKHWYFEV